MIRTGLFTILFMLALCADAKAGFEAWYSGTLEALNMKEYLMPNIQSAKIRVNPRFQFRVYSRSAPLRACP